MAHFKRKNTYRNAHSGSKGGETDMNKRKIKKAYMIELTDQELDWAIRAENTLHALFKQVENKSATTRTQAYEKWWNIWLIIEQISRQKDSRENTMYSNEAFIHSLTDKGGEI